MMKNYRIWKNGFFVRKMVDVTFEAVVEFCDKFSNENSGDWVEATIEGNNSVSVYKRCGALEVREVG
jgi:Leu/Phe-tRNA-protein transferase